jgi:hypothetical protein
MPTIGQLDFAAAGSGLAFAFANFDCGNFLPLVFFREEDALDNAFRFAAMRPFYVSLGLTCIQAVIVRVERVVLNALPKCLRLFRLIFARSAMDVQGVSHRCLGLTGPVAT